MATSSNQYGATAAPPPTPSMQPNPLSSSSDAADSLSRLFLLHLPPNILSPPSRRNSSTTSISTISLSDLTSTPSLLLSAASKLGFFQLTNHSIPSQLAHSADSDSQSLFHLPNHQKRLHYPPNWPLGYDEDEDGETNNTEASFCFDSSCSAESDELLSLASLREFAREMEKVGLAIIEALSCAVGFVNPVRADPGRICSLMWISEDTTLQSPSNQLLRPGKIYPYVVGLHYQVRCRKSTMLSDSGWVSVSPQVDSILVTLGDIAQVWSNGKLKKVRGRPVSADGTSSQSISTSLLLTLPLDSIVSPALIIPTIIVNDGSSDEVESREEDDDEEEEEYIENPASSHVVEEISGGRRVVFNSFSFEDYAWRVYHERVLHKDPLDRYRAQ